MRIVIEIPRTYYEVFKECNTIVNGRGNGKILESTIYDAVRNGIPLPEHYGRLIDAKVACPNHTECVMCPVAIECPICAAPTIIPATGNEFFNFDAPLIKKEEATKRDNSAWDFHWDGRGDYEQARAAFYGDFS